MKYLHTTRDLWLTLGGDNTDIECYTDSDFCSQPDCRSISGHVLKFGLGAVAWSSKRQPVIATSSTEAEYIAALVSAKEIYWARAFAGERPHNTLLRQPIQYRAHEGQ
jgi:hypothetical protein